MRFWRGSDIELELWKDVEEVVRDDIVFMQISNYES
jgi:hypothetical protein